MEVDVRIRAKIYVSVLGGLLLTSGCSVGNGTENATNTVQDTAAAATNTMADPKIAAAQPDNAISAGAALTGTHCFARKDDAGAAGVVMTFENGAAKGNFYMTAVDPVSRAYSGSFGAVSGQMKGDRLSVTLEPQGGTSANQSKSAEEWTYSKAAFVSGTAAYKPADCAEIKAEYEKRSGEE
jgi:PBP1b-binding outer membrane lipoprotein LpoB